jgi:uncharacterized membrane protein YdbT with pleckstrin-like domain
MGIEKQLQPGEKILYRAHPSRVVLIPLIALGVVVLAAGPFIRGFTQNDMVMWACVGVGVVILIFAGIRHLSLFTNEYFVTDRRIIRQTGVLAKSSMDIYLEKINNVEHRQSLWGRMLGFGDVEIDTASQVGEAHFPRIAHPLEFKKTIVGAAEAYRGAGRSPAAVSAPVSSGADRLRDLKRLLDEHLINQAEYDAKRKQLLEEI